MMLRANQFTFYAIGTPTIIPSRISFLGKEIDQCSNRKKRVLFSSVNNRSDRMATGNVDFLYVISIYVAEVPALRE